MLGGHQARAVQVNTVGGAGLEQGRIGVDEHLRTARAADIAGAPRETQELRWRQGLGPQSHQFHPGIDAGRQAGEKGVDTLIR